MDEVFDEKAILARIRQQLRSDLRDTVADRPAAPAGWAGDVDVDVAELRDAKDIYGLPLRTQRRTLGPALVLANRLLRKLLKPSLERQVTYNAANERLLRMLLVEVATLKTSQAALNERCDSLQAELTALQDAKRSG